VAYVVAALVFTCLLTLLNLLLLLGVVRRLRAQDGRTDRPAGGSTRLEPLPPVGTLIEDVAAVDVAGIPVRRADLDLVGFFSPGCEPCDALLPQFIGYAAGLPGGRDDVLAVVVGVPGEVAEAVARLSAVARVVVEEPPAGPLAGAFRVTGYPAVFRLDGTGRVLGSGASLDRLPVAAG
jgi:thiol-disulfide isomerase/thioredoxin